MRWSYLKLPFLIFSLILSLCVEHVSLANSTAWDQTVDESIEYNRDVRPILTENCFACHGPDSAARAADLRLDQRDAAIESGALSPGSLEDSSVWQRIISDGDEIMPPAESHKTLDNHEKDILRRWIESGADYQPHWAFIPPVKSELPQVEDPRWATNPIDRFVWSRLKQQGLSPAPEADRSTLARRLSLDITGLPPTPELVQQFVEDTSPDAYEKLVDRLLASPSWGEHRGRYWLDVARYADTHGIHFDNYREIWAYRDWVIDAFNRNLPFDQFTIEQLAGDLLPEATLDQQVATGFNRCNITTNEGGIIDEEYKVLYARDRTETTAQTWMGLTVGCAVCHDHKFDPLTQREFYELSAFFNNTTQAVRDGNIKDTPPTVFVPLREERDRWESIAVALESVEKKLTDQRGVAEPAFVKWLETKPTSEQLPALPADNLRFQFSKESAAVTREFLVDGKPQTKTHLQVSDAEFPNAIVEAGQKLDFASVGDFEVDQPFSYGGWIRFEGNNNNGSLFARMDEANGYRGWDLWCEGGRIGTHLVNSWPGNALKVVAQQPVPSGKWTHVFVTYDGSKKAAGIRIYINGEAVATNIPTDQLSESIRTQTPFQLFQRSATARVPQARLADVKIYQSKLQSHEVRDLAKRREILLALSAVGQGNATEVQRELVFQWYLQNLDEEYGRLLNEQSELRTAQSQLRSRGTLAHVMHEANNQPKAFVLNRGEYDQRRDEVSIGTPAMLPPFAEGLEPNRMGLAKWLLSPEHPLTARVTVNRFWQSVFGQGIVATSGDFGLTGLPPTHPELLDWLAIDFRENGWDVKRFFKQVVMSQTYRQSAVATDEKLEQDPGNTWYSRGPRFRMDAEMVRDYGLAVSGLLVQKIGGPSVRPYQPPGVWEAVAMPESNTRNYRRDSGENLYRRSMYTFWKRSAPPASMDIFNAPNREICTVRRERTNTPLQALATLNDPQFIEAARVLADQSLRQPEFVSVVANADAGRMNWLSMKVLCRQLEERELDVMLGVLEELRQHYGDNKEDANSLLAIGETKLAEDADIAELAVWTMVVNQFMNLDETLCK